MAFAPSILDNRYTFDASGVQRQNAILGSFRSAETDVYFEFTDRFDDPADTFAPDFPHRICVLDGTRCARVLKTVAYIVTDEAADGSPVVEKWAIKQHRAYAG